VNSKSKRWIVLSACLAALAAGPARAQVDAVTKPKDDRALGFSLRGKVVQVAVKEGDHVKKGDLLMKLDDSERAALVDLYKLKADSITAKKGAEARLKLAQIEYDATKASYDKGAATKIELDRAEATVAVRASELEQTDQDTAEAKLQLRQAEAIRDQYHLFAPIDGIIDDLMIQEGEIVDERTPVIRLVVTDPLWIDAAVSSVDAKRYKLDDPAWVQLKEKHEGTMVLGPAVKGKIIHIAEVAQASSATKLVRIEVPKQNGIGAGDHVVVSFTPPASLAKAAPADR
jgi:RND family efflux transporter MFP subunit